MGAQCALTSVVFAGFIANIVEYDNNIGQNVAETGKKPKIF
jgi:hypothetical protein